MIMAPVKVQRKTLSAGNRSLWPTSTVTIHASKNSHSPPEVG
jgi:hypothetical protein